MCLPVIPRVLLNSSVVDCTLIGWGVTDYGDETVLQKIDVPIRTWQYCEDWDLHMTERLLCAGPADPKGNACWGDSGGEQAVHDTHL